MISLIAMALATTSVAGTLPPSTPIYCRDSTDADQPVRQTDYARLVKAHRDLFGFAPTFIGGGSAGDRLVFRGGVRNAETISYSARLMRRPRGPDALVLLSSHAQFYDGYSDGQTGSFLCAAILTLIVSSDEKANLPKLATGETDDENPFTDDVPDMVAHDIPEHSVRKSNAEHTKQTDHVRRSRLPSPALPTGSKRWQVSRTSSGACQAVKTENNGTPSALLVANGEGTLMAFPASIVEANLAPHDLRTSVSIETGGSQLKKFVSFKIINPLDKDTWLGVVLYPKDATLLGRATAIRFMGTAAEPGGHTRRDAYITLEGISQALRQVTSC